MKKIIELKFEEFDGPAHLSAPDAELLSIARMATGNAYAPYSGFSVAAAARLSNGEIVTGTNQENASYPAGICAERVLLSAVASQFSGSKISAIAVSYNNRNGGSDQPVSPCGICRQSLVEYERRNGDAIRLILSGQSGPVLVIESAADLLPLAFTNEELKRVR